MDEREKTSHRSIGDFGESLALEYLKSQGYEIIEQNYQIQGGEIDIIAKFRGIFIFCEVKYRKDESYGHPLDTLTYGKRRSLKRTISHYQMRNRISLEESRVDFIGIMDDPREKSGYKIWHEIGIEL